MVFTSQIAFFTLRTERGARFAHDLGGRNRLNAVPAPDLEVAQNPDRIRSIPPVQQERNPAEDRNRGNEAPRNNVLSLGNEQDNNRNVRSPEDPIVQTPPAVPAAGGRSAYTARFEMMFVGASEVAAVWQTWMPSTYQTVPEGSIATP